MSLTVLPLGPQHVRAAARLAAEVSPRPTSAAFERWSFLDAPLHRGFVAMDGEEPAALLRAFERAYRTGDRVERWLETFDWYATPAQRVRGAGLAVMRAAMEQPLPLINIGGADETPGLLARLGWRPIGEAVSYLLPVRGHGLERALEGRGPVVSAVARVGAGAVTRLRFRAARAIVRTPGTVVPVAAPGPELGRLYERGGGHRTLPLPDESHLRWLLAGFAGTGHFIPLYFVRGDDLIGWGLARVRATPRGSEAILVDAFAPERGRELYPWIVSRLVAAVLPFDPVLVRARATSHELQRALGRAGFLRTRAFPVQYFSAGRDDPPPVEAALNVQDSPFVPYPERWVLDGTGSA